MRFNSTELKILSESKDCKLEGLLEILEDNGKFWSKGEGLIFHTHMFEF